MKIDPDTLAPDVAEAAAARLFDELLASAPATVAGFVRPTLPPEGSGERLGDRVGFGTPAGEAVLPRLRETPGDRLLPGSPGPAADALKAGPAAACTATSTGRTNSCQRHEGDPRRGRLARPDPPARRGLRQQRLLVAPRRRPPRVRRRRPSRRFIDVGPARLHRGVPPRDGRRGAAGRTGRAGVRVRGVADARVREQRVVSPKRKRGPRPAVGLACAFRSERSQPRLRFGLTSSEPPRRALHPARGGRTMRGPAPRPEPAR